MILLEIIGNGKTREGAAEGEIGDERTPGFDGQGDALPRAMRRWRSQELETR